MAKLKLNRNTIIPVSEMYETLTYLADSDIFKLTIGEVRDMVFPSKHGGGMNQEKLTIMLLLSLAENHPEFEELYENMMSAGTREKGRRPIINREEGEAFYITLEYEDLVGYMNKHWVGEMLRYGILEPSDIGITKKEADFLKRFLETEMLKQIDKTGGYIDILGDIYRSVNKGIDFDVKNLRV
jgi:hypothetical protein